MRIMGALVMSAIVLGACGSDSDSAADACGDISGNYSIESSKLEGGDCSAELDASGKSTMGVVNGGGGAYTLTFPSVTGGCPGTLDAACKLKANCEATGKDGVTIVATVSIEYTFSKTGFTGTTLNGARPPAVAKACSDSYRDVGTRL